MVVAATVIAPCAIAFADWALVAVHSVAFTERHDVGVAAQKVCAGLLARGITVSEVIGHVRSIV